jgi:hypothetical protein
MIAPNRVHDEAEAVLTHLLRKLNLAEMSWIGTNNGRNHMDPEERLWFLELAVAVYVSESPRKGTLAVVDANDSHQYVWLAQRNGTVTAEVGARERYALRPLSPAAVTRLGQLGFERSAFTDAFVRHGLVSDPVILSRLVERLFLVAYDLPGNFVVRVGFDSLRATRRLRRAMRIQRAA